MFRKVPSGHVGYVTAPKGLGHNDYGVAMPKKSWGIHRKTEPKAQAGEYKERVEANVCLKEESGGERREGCPRNRNSCMVCQPILCNSL
jgi:hypothetical protein